MPFELHSWNWQNATEFNGFQGRNPDFDNVTRIILAKDANFPPSETLDNHPEAATLLHQYLNNPEEFFETNTGYHHPSRCNQWAVNALNGGRRYHSTFSRILNYATAPQNLGQAISDIAMTTSFLELLKFPTFGNSGRNSRFLRYLSGDFDDGQFEFESNISFEARNNHGWTCHTQFEHLNNINRILGTPNKTIFVFRGFPGLIQSFQDHQLENLSNAAPLLVSMALWLDEHPDGQGDPPEGIAAEIVPHTHFSAAISNQELIDLSQHFQAVD